MAWTENQMNPLHKMIVARLKESPATMREIIDYCIPRLTTTPGVSAGVTINHVHQLWGVGVLARERVDGESKDIYEFRTNDPDRVNGELLRPMKVKDILSSLKNVDPELDVFASDPDRSSIIWEVIYAKVVEVECDKEFAPNEFNSHDFPIGYKFMKLG